MNRILADLRLALRAWRKSPGFTAIAIASIAVGIGANTAIFTLVDQVLLRALPVKNPSALVQVTYRGSAFGSNWGDGSELSYPMFTDFRDNNQVFDGMFCRFSYPMHTGYGGRTERAAGEIVSGTYFQVLGVTPAAGRLLTPDDDKAPGGHPVVVLSHGFWTSRFAGDRSIVGKSMVVNGHPFTVLGVAQAGFEGVELGEPTQIFVPTMMKAQVTPGWNGLDDRRWSWLRVFGRLKPGVSPEQAQAALAPFYRSRLEMEVKEPAFANVPERGRKRFLDNKLSIVPAAQGRSGFRESMTAPLWVLMGTAVGVLLIACANVANLLLARGASRQREMAVRLALGATRGGLVRQLLIESLALAAAGGIVGVFLSVVGAPIVLSFFVNPETPQPISTAPDVRILAFTFAVSALTGILFGLAPALRSTKPTLAPTLKEYAGSVLGGGQARIRKALVATQVGLSLLLLIAAGLFIRTLDNLLAVDIGFQTRSLISFSLDPSLNGYSPARTKQFTRTLLERLNNTPGIAASGLASMRLLEGNQWSSGMSIAGYTPGPDERTSTLCNMISPGYFKAMGIPLLRGRDFTDKDERLEVPKDDNGFRVAIANEHFAKKYFAGRNPIGGRIGFGSNPNTPTPIEIVGVVRDSKYTGVRDDVRPGLFFPFLESDDPGGGTVYARTTQPPDAVFATVREIVRQIDPNLPIHGTRTLERQVEQSLSNERLVATMTTLFGVLATLLAVVGLYGVMAYTVARRTREIGIRMALGARASAIGWLVIREVLVIATVGIALALPVAWWLSRYVESELYGVKPTDAITVAGSVVLLVGVAALAGLVPSARAARVNPTTALRYE
ncbi:MAG TPA: ABC transporter permease [Vicinamibacterales bacterium]|jgi:predicted permease|nr:ABC transporter permease [Vicinamibacterales bacterium]